LAVDEEKGIESIEQAIEDSRKLDTIPQSFLLDKRRTFAI